MTHQRHRRAPAGALLPMGLLALAAVAGCGGGGGDAASPFVNPLSTQDAQGYAADAATTPVTAADGIDAATRALEAAVTQGTTAAASPALQALSLRPAATGPTVPPGGPTITCVGGGSISWSVTGGTAAQLLNARLDAGETYEVAYRQCNDGATTVDGSLSLVVAANDATASDYTVTASSLTTVTAQGTSTLDGSVRERRSVAPASGGGTQTQTRFTASGLAMTSVTAAGTSHYTLRTLDWTASRSTDAAGNTTARSHQGALVLVASPARRPSTTLQVSTQGALAAGSDGWVTQGSLAVVTADGDSLGIVVGNTTVSLTLDLGNDGRVDARWTLPRGTFLDSAG